MRQSDFASEIGNNTKTQVTDKRLLLITSLIIEHYVLVLDDDAVA